MIPGASEPAAHGPLHAHQPGEVRQGLGAEAMTYLTRIDPARNMARFYSLEIQNDLFGELVLRTAWGRIGRGGSAKSTVCPDPSAAVNAVSLQMHRKQRRGYTIV